MGGDLFAGLLPYLPGLPFSIALIVVYRLWTAAVKELRVERADHRHTQGELDAERESRRKVEDKVDLLSREVRAQTAEMSRQTGELSRQTGELSRQTAEVKRLTAEVTRLQTKVGELT